MPRWVVVIAVLAALLGACTDSREDSAPPDFELVVDEDGFPRFESWGSAVLADSPAEVDDAWRDFDLDGSPSEALGPEDSEVLFVYFGESGSCPVEPGEVEVEAKNLRIPDDGKHGACTLDFRPRTFVYRVAEGAIPEGRVTVHILEDDIPLRRPLEG
jgi:hypothetical protein